jgi:hypothetical protein
MALVEIRVLKLLARWLGDGRLVVGSSARDIDACLEHVTALCAIRSTRRWEVIFSMRMQVSVHVGRNAWLLATHRRAVANHQRQQVFNNAQFELLRIVEAGQVARIQELENEVLELQGGQDELLMELDELRRAEHAERAEPEQELDDAPMP